MSDIKKVPRCDTTKAPQHDCCLFYGDYYWVLVDYCVVYMDRMPLAFKTKEQAADYAKLFPGSEVRLLRRVYLPYYSKLLGEKG